MSLEEQLNSRIENARSQMNEKDDEIYENEIPAEYVEIASDFSMLMSWMKSEHLNFRLKKKNPKKDYEVIARNLTKNKEKMKEFNKGLNAKKEFIRNIRLKINEAEKKKNLEGIIEEIDKRSERFEETLELIRETVGKLEGFKKVSPFHPRRKLKYFNLKKNKNWLVLILAKKWNFHQ